MDMTNLRADAKKAVESLGFTNSLVTKRKWRKKPAIRIHIPIEKNGTWNDEYRERLDALCQKLSDLGLRWCAEYPNMNHLLKDPALNGGEIDNNPWTLFNGASSLDLIPESYVG